MYISDHANNMVRIITYLCILEANNYGPQLPLIKLKLIYVFANDTPIQKLNLVGLHRRKNESTVICEIQ